MVSAVYYNDRHMPGLELYKVTVHSLNNIQKVLNKLEKMNLVSKIKTKKRDRNNRIIYDWTINIKTFRRYFKIIEKYKEK